MLSKQVDRIKINLNNFKIYILRKKKYIYIHIYIYIYIYICVCVYGWVQVTSGVILNNITPPNNLL